MPWQGAGPESALRAMYQCAGATAGHMPRSATDIHTIRYRYLQYTEYGILIPGFVSMSAGDERNLARCFSICSRHNPYREGREGRGEIRNARSD